MGQKVARVYVDKVGRATFLALILMVVRGAELWPADSRRETFLAVERRYNAYRAGAGDAQED